MTEETFILTKEQIQQLILENTKQNEICIGSIKVTSFNSSLAEVEATIDRLISKHKNILEIQFKEKIRESSYYG